MSARERSPRRSLRRGSAPKNSPLSGIGRFRGVSHREKRVFIVAEGRRARDKRRKRHGSFDGAAREIRRKRHNSFPRAARGKSRKRRSTRRMRHKSAPFAARDKTRKRRVLGIAALFRAPSPSRALPYTVSWTKNRKICPNGQRRSRVHGGRRQGAY